MNYKPSTQTSAVTIVFETVLYRPTRRMWRQCWRDAKITWWSFIPSAMLVALSSPSCSFVFYTARPHIRQVL